MMRKLILIIVLALAFLATNVSLKAQQIGVLNTSLVNPYSINPSQAGINGNMFYIQHRNQWVDVQGAPEYSILTSEWRLLDTKSALGISLSNDKVNVLKSTFAYLSYAGHFKLNDKHNLSFGLSLGVKNNTIMYDQLTMLQEDDLVVFDYDQSGMNFDANFGITYSVKNLEVQLAAMQLPGNNSVFRDSYQNKEMSFDFVRHYFGSIGYQFMADKTFRVKPVIRVIGVEGLPFMPEGVVTLDYKKMASLSLHYMHGRSYGITTSFAINETFQVGYSTEFASTRFAGFSGATHEVLLGIRFGKPFYMGDEKKPDPNAFGREFEERFEFMNQENLNQQEEIERQKKKIRELEKGLKDLDYDQLKKTLQQIKNTAPQSGGVGNSNSIQYNTEQSNQGQENATNSNASGIDDGASNQDIDHSNGVNSEGQSGAGINPGQSENNSYNTSGGNRAGSNNNNYSNNNSEEQGRESSKSNYTEKTLPTEVKVILFDFKSTELNPENYQDLDEIISRLRTNPSSELVINGYADNTGSIEANEAISRKRATVVKEYFVREGQISGKRIKINAFGETNPIVPNDTDKGRISNRRVEILFSKE